MAMSGQNLSRDGQSRLQPFEQAPRPMVGYAGDYDSGHETGLHHHARAQLLFAIAGVMRITTEVALFTIPPGTGLWVPADTLHAVRMDGVVQMRALFLRADAAARGPEAVTVIAVSSLLRELILTVCGSRWFGMRADRSGWSRNWCCMRSRVRQRRSCRCRRVAIPGWRAWRLR